MSQCQIGKCTGESPCFCQAEAVKRIRESDIVVFPVSAMHEAFKERLHTILYTIGPDAETKLTQVDELIERYQKLEKGIGIVRGEVWDS